MPQIIEKISLGDTLELSGVIAGIENGAVTLTNKTTGCVIPPALRHQRAPGADHPRGRPFELHPRKKPVNTGISAPRRLSRHVRRQK